MRVPGEGVALCPQQLQAYLCPAYSCTRGLVSA